MRWGEGEPWPGLTLPSKAPLGESASGHRAFSGLALSSPTSPPRPAVVYWEPGVWPGRLSGPTAGALPALSLSAHARPSTLPHHPVLPACGDSLVLTLLASFVSCSLLCLLSAGLQGTVTNLPGLQPEWGTRYLPPGQWAAVKELEQTCWSSEPSPYGAGRAAWAWCPE